MMRYISTRGACAPVSFLDAVLAGLAPDGGLYVPETWPTLAPDVLARAATAPYAETAAAVLRAFAGDDLTPAECDAIAKAAYASGAFPPFLVRMVQVGEETGNVGAMLVRAADMIEERAEQQIQRFVIVFQPMILVIIGIIIGGLLYGLFSAILSINQTIL